MLQAYFNSDSAGRLLGHRHEARAVCVHLPRVLLYSGTFARSLRLVISATTTKVCFLWYWCTVYVLASMRDRFGANFLTGRLDQRESLFEGHFIHPIAELQLRIERLGLDDAGEAVFDATMLDVVGECCEFR